MTHQLVSPDCTAISKSKWYSGVQGGGGGKNLKIHFLCYQGFYRPLFISLTHAHVLFPSEELMTTNKIHRIRVFGISLCIK